MSSARRSVTLSDIFQIWNADPEYLSEAHCEDPQIDSVSLWEPTFQHSEATLAIIPRVSVTTDLETFTHDLVESGPACAMLASWPEEELKILSATKLPVTLVRAPVGLSTTTLFENSLRATVDPTTAELRRLTSLQRSFTQELSSSAPTQGILNRLQKLSSAVALVVTSQGSVRENTGQIPLGKIFEQLSKTDSPSQFVSSGEWSGQAVRLRPAGSAHSSGGWLVAACRRPNFPDASASAAIHIAASLIETVQRIDTQARSQEQAVRTSLFEQALSFKPSKDAPELESRVAALGFSYDLPMRVLVTGPISSRTSKNPRLQILEKHQLLTDTFNEAEIVSLSTTHSEGSVFLLQASESSIQRVLRTHRKSLKDQLFALGRNITRITDTSDSYADAWLGIRTLRANPHLGNDISFEQFDFATRLFSNVGIDVMAEWSKDFLEPVLERDQVLVGLREYFLHAQNIAAAADALGIHHNSLRYRLAKVEELLSVNLRDPAAISSLFLAITSLDLAVLSGSSTPNAQPNSNDLVPDPVNAAGFITNAESKHRFGATLKNDKSQELFAGTLRR